MSTLTQHTALPIKGTMAKNILLSFLGSIAIAISAQISVPMFPVPMSMQGFAVLCVGSALGARFGALAVIMYIAEGLAGLPVFAGGSFGIAALLGTSGGFLFGFVAMAYIVGSFADKGWDKTASKAFVAMFLGHVALYAAGLLQLGTIVGWDKPVLAWGLTPFIVGDFVKMGVASALLPMIWNKFAK